MCYLGRLLSLALIIQMLCNAPVAAQHWLSTGGPSNGSVQVTSLVFDGQGNLLAGTNAGFWVQRQGRGTWDEENDTVSGTPIANIEVNAIAATANCPMLIGTRFFGVYRADSLGAPWEGPDPKLDGLTIEAVITRPDGIALASFIGYVYRSTDCGRSWQDSRFAVDDGTNTIQALALAEGGDFVAATISGVYISTDGTAWSAVLPNVNATALTTGKNGFILVGTSSELLFSSDLGLTWESLGSTQSTINGLAINKSGQLLASTSRSGLYRFTGEPGEILEPVPADGLPLSPGITTLAISPRHDGLYVGTNTNGVYQSRDQQIPQMMHAGPESANEGEPLLLQADLSDDVGVQEVAVHYRTGGDSTFSDTSLVITSNGKRAGGAIPARAVTLRGLEYYLIARDEFGNIKRVPAAGANDVLVQVTNVTSPAIISGADTSNYRLFSLPLQLANNNAVEILFNSLGDDDDGKNWRCLELDSNYLNLPLDSMYKEYPHTGNFEPGNAFWLIVRDAGKTIQAGPGTTLSLIQERQVPLHPGWNIFGNPFAFDLPVTSLRLQSNNQVDVRAFTGKWQTGTSIIRPFEGYAIFNNADADVLYINPALPSATSTMGTGPAAQWSIAIGANVRGARDTDNYLGIAEPASTTWDESDLPEPPVIDRFVSVYFPHPEWQHRAKRFCTDFRPAFSQGETWKFEVTTNVRDRVDLTFDGTSEVPTEFEIWLVDDLLGIRQDLRKNKRYSVAGVADHAKRLKLVIGRSEFVDENGGAASNLPAIFELAQNFPNPFNPATTIGFGLPEAETVSLTIFNIRGDKVTTLLDEERKEAGYHTEVWNGRNSKDQPVASGIYVYQLRAGNLISVKKMALLK